MIEEKLFTTLAGSYHDCALENAAYKDGHLFLYCFRNPPNMSGAENPDFRYIIIRFDHVTALEIYDWDKREYLPYTGKPFEKIDGNIAFSDTNYIAYLDFEEGFVVFGECLRFRCEDVIVLANSCDELDFQLYVIN